MSTRNNNSRSQWSIESVKHEGAQAKRVASDRIAEDLVRFKASGGSVEVLGTTRVLKKIDEVPAE